VLKVFLVIDCLLTNVSSGCCFALSRQKLKVCVKFLKFEIKDPTFLFSKVQLANRLTPCVVKTYRLEGAARANNPSSRCRLV